MPLLKVQACLNHSSALPEDVCINTFHFNAATISEASAGTIATNVIDFYNHAPTAESAVSAYIANHMVSLTCKAYDMTGPPPHPPIATTIPVVLDVRDSGLDLPSEVAVCLSLAGPALAGADQANRRGRVFIGPLNGAASVGQPARPSLVVTQALHRAAAKLFADSNADGAPWVVWSPTNAAMVPITQGWVDNTFDTQRRRGEKATVRNSITF